MSKFHNILNILNDHFSQKAGSSSYTDQIFDKQVTPEPEDGIPEDLDDESDDASKSDDHYKESFLGMSVSSLRNVLDNVNNILTNLENPRVKENLTEPWLQGMIAVVEDNMSSVHDFVMFSDHNDDNSSDASKKRPGLWENIRKKKEREGKNYKPAKPGDKDRPDPETWKKLTKDDKKSE